MSDNDSSSESSASAAESEPTPAHWNVNSRQRRTTAGNRLSTLLQQEESKDDDVELLFEENEEEPDEDFDVPVSAPASDVEANDEGGGSDSSSSSEDEGDVDDELVGEKQLEREERQAKKKQKRKADATLAKPRSTKRVKIAEPSQTDSPGPRNQRMMPPPPRPRKKSERVSWVLAADTAQRTSSRALSVQNKERTQASLYEAEKKRVKQMAVMEAAAKRKDASKKQPLNQAERMAEAARTERQNAKSLNRWEEMERDRVAKQKAKQDALQNRVLEGPVIRWWSGRAEWVDGKCVKVGKGKMVEEVHDIPAKTRKTDPTKKDSPGLPVRSRKSSEQRPADDVLPRNESEGNAAHPTTEDRTTVPVESAHRMDIHKFEATSTPQPQTQHPIQLLNTSPSQQPSSFLEGIDYYAAHPEDAPPPQSSAATIAQSAEPSSIHAHLQQQVDAGAINAISSAAASQTLPLQVQQPPSNVPSPAPPQALPTNLTHPLDALAAFTAAPPHPSTQLPSLQQQSIPPASKPAYSSLQTLTLLNYPATVTGLNPTGVDLRRRIIFGLPHSSALKPTKPSQVLCAATGQPARYWDPKLGVGYRDSDAGRRLRGLVGMDDSGNGMQGMNGSSGGQRAVWSQVLGAWVASGPGVRGVPPGFDGVMDTEDLVVGERMDKGDGMEDVKPSIAAS